MKAVVWTDALQIGVMLAGLLALLIQAVINVGGFSKMIEINKKGDRMPKLE